MRKGKGRKGMGAGHTGIQQETDPEKEGNSIWNRRFGKESKS